MYKSRFFMQLSVFLFSLFLLGGCGANNSESSPNSAPGSGGEGTDSSVTAKMSVYNGNSITASTGGETLSIVIQAFTKSDTDAEGKIVAQYVETDGKNGSLTPTSATLSNGFATFTYTAPINLQAEIDSGNTGTSFRFYAYSSDDEILSDVAPITVNITFDTTSIPDIGGNPIAKLEISNGTSTITSSGESVTVNVLAKDSQGYPVKGGTVRVKYPANAVRVGLFSNDEVAVSTSGIATFSYIGPDPLSYGGTSFTFEYKENPIYTANWTVYFRPTVEPVDPVTPTYPIVTIAATQDITADSDGYTQTIEVLALMSGNAPAPEGKISVIYPADAATKNIGTFTPATASITDGKATFSYSGPTPLVADSDQIFTFRATDYPTASDTVTVSYSPKIDPTTPVAQTINIINDDDNNPANGKSIDITENGEVVNIRVRVYGADNNPFDGGNVKVQFPDVAVSGTDVGSFATLSVPCVNGVADFTYAAPANINGRSDSFDFTFTHDSVNSPASQVLTVVMNPSGTQQVLTNYILTMANSDGNNSISIETSKTFSVAVVDDNGNLLTQDATYIITNDYTSLADINDTSGASATPDMTVVGINANFSVTAKKKSGIFPIKVHVDFIDANGDAKSLEKVFNVTIYSGPPTAMSISYVSTGQDEGHSQFIEVFSVKLTDKYNNPVNTQPYIHVGAIAGYAKDPTQYGPIKAAVTATRDGTPTAIPVSANYATSRLFNGNLIALREDVKVDSYSADQAQITIRPNALGGSTNYDLSALDIYNNNIVTFGDGYVYHKSGKWDISSVSGVNTIIVDEKYNGTSVNYDLGFAIGNNFRQDTCKFGEEWVLTTESDDGTYQVDADGYARVKMPYDYYLVGKDVIVYANLIGDVLGATDESTRVGEAKKVTLRGHELTPYPSAYTIAKGAPASYGYIFEWKLKDTQEWYRNGNFGGYEMKYSGEGAICGFPRVNDYRNCERNGGVAYIDYQCSGGTEDGSITMTDAVVSTEFQH